MGARKKKRTVTRSRRPSAEEKPYPPQRMVYFYEDDRLVRLIGLAEKADFEFALQCTDGNVVEAGHLVCVDRMIKNPVMLYGMNRLEAETKYRKKHGLPPPKPPAPAKPRGKNKKKPGKKKHALKATVRR